ncbi:short-chain dehydrogenase reductase sdr [Trichoderma arundinaceum]|uniref:Short-chain dehydrogenase reductase sdr n=1 Tax=Trichoderma arundinaceum TaxID=490622 RepID=A0A395NM60_TRIAR|nr:short-chain dehydrogenase reductase sdr [Trichoderma arundinaceum]
MASLLEGSAFVTGAASGIGEKTAYAFAKYGISKLAIADINLEGLQTVAANLQKEWPDIEVLTLKIDVRKAEEVKSGLAQVVSNFGRLDVAVNNAGISGKVARVHELEEADWNDVLNINLTGVHLCQKEELAIMVNQEYHQLLTLAARDLGVRRGRGAIINVSSMYGVVGPLFPIHQTAYSAAKHAVVGMTKADASSYAGTNIRINAICPGYIETPMIKGGTASLVQGHPLHSHVQNTPLKRLGLPEEIADSIVFLASPLSSYVNGFGLVADGGYTGC